MYFTPERIVKAAVKLYALPKTSMNQFPSSVDSSTTQEHGGAKIEHAAELVDEGPKLSPDQKKIDGGVLKEDLAALRPHHVLVDLIARHHGMEDKNPLDYVKFYSKQHPNGKPCCSVRGKSFLIS